MDDILSLGVWIKRRRKALDLTQDELARQVGCSLETIRKIEGDACRPSRQIAALLAEHLALTPEERDDFIRCARAELTIDRLPLPAQTVPHPTLVPAARTQARVEQPAQVILPGGTVTFLFTDIEGSTALWERHRQAMGDALARHEAILRQAIESHGGVVFKTVGDAVCAAFASAPQALAAAMDAQRGLASEVWTAIGSLLVRVALHTGTAELCAGDYTGFALSRVARILAAGHGDQVLLSQSTYELVRNHLPPGAELRDLGAHRLKDLTHPEQLFQLVAPGLQADFPPLRRWQALQRMPGRLPIDQRSELGGLRDRGGGRVGGGTGAAGARRAAVWGGRSAGCGSLLALRSAPRGAYCCCCARPDRRGILRRGLGCGSADDAGAGDRRGVGPLKI